MGKKNKNSKRRAGDGPAAAPASSISRDDYEAELHLLQVELVKLQRSVIRRGERVLVILEGRDAAGKDGSIKRFVEYLSPRETRVVALGKPSDRERDAWYFQRYVAQLPCASELVLFNRSWYNRAGVERVLGFCSEAEHETFMQSVPRFEELLVNSGVRLLKYYLDISKAEQRRRLADRALDPLKQWKISAVDGVALKHWKAYGRARDEMLLRSHSVAAPWRIIRADDKMLARLNLLRDVLTRLPYAGKKRRQLQADARIVFEYTADRPMELES